MTTKKPDDGGPAFPVDKFDYDNTTTYGGLTKREYFAAMAMQGYLSDSRTMGNISEDSKRLGVSGTKYICAACVEMADALLAELKKGSVEND